MDYVIIGTAGHIDHGKTALIKALTGTDTDRFQEEKMRGISIDIGFAPLVLSDGRRIGIVDVPGHERFIRNMLAGAGGVDFILLVVDAREGVMPQTREHLAIMSLLTISHGLIVITKMDLVDEEWLSFVHQEVRQELADSFLANAPMIDVSSVTGQGIDLLKRTIENVLPEIPRKSSQGAFRLPIDRAFVVQGIGTVVTGTVWRGKVQTGDTLSLLPGDETVRVRSIQVHGENNEIAYAGQRAALAIVGIRGEVHRGMTLSTQGVYSTTRLVDVRIQILKDAARSVKHRERIRCYLGTQEVLGRVLLLFQLEINPGDEAVAQLLLESDVVAEARDHCVIRTYSPMHTIAGGTIIDPHPARLYRRNKTSIVENLLKKEQGSLGERILAVLTQKRGLAVSELSFMLGETETVIQAELQHLLDDGQLIRGKPRQELIPMSLIEAWTAQVLTALVTYFHKNPYDLWVPKSVLSAELKASGIESNWLEPLLVRVHEQRPVIVQMERVRFVDRAIVLTNEEQNVRDQVWKLLQDSPFAPPGTAEMEQLLHLQGKEKLMKTALHILVQEDQIIAINPDVYMVKTAVLDAAQIASTLFAQKGAFSLADFRDTLATSRKYAVAMLEYFDRQKWTRRTGEVREWLKKSLGK